LDELEDRIRDVIPETPVLHSVLRPWPLASIAQRSVVFATTAPEPVAARSAAQLESRHGAHVVGWTSHLSERARLAEDLDRLPEADVLVTELKAAAVDVATRAALERDMEVVYCDNRPEPVPMGRLGDDEFDTAMVAVADLAVERFEADHPST
jgi:cyclic 2,3-diphosphoglycerate synthetase